MKAINDLLRHNASIAPLISQAVDRVIARGWYILGPEVQAFEQAFAVHCGTAGCAAVANGTDALELALRALGVAAEGEVITVANAGGYCTAAILAIGARPVYVDIQPDMMTLDPALLPAACSARTKAIVVTHLYGRMADMPRVLEFAAAAGVPVLEDCAQAHGASQHGRRAGSWGRAGAFSFYPTKNLGALGDGAVVGNDPAVLARVRQLRQYGWGRKYESELRGGRNSRLDELQAAILLAKLPFLDGWNARRRSISARYRQRITHPLVTCPPAAGDDFVAHLFVVRAKQRDALRRHLAAAGVPADVHYPIPDHRQAAWPDLAPSAALPETERAAREVLTLPCFPEMDESEVDLVCAAVNDRSP